MFKLVCSVGVYGCVKILGYGIKKAMSAFGINAMAVNLFRDWNRVQEDGSGSKSRVQMQQWCKLPPEWIKIKIDVSCRVDYDFIGAGCVVRTRIDVLCVHVLVRLEEECKQRRGK